MQKMILETELFDGTTLQVTIRPRLGANPKPGTVIRYNHLCPKGKIRITRDEAIKLANLTKAPIAI